MQVRLKRFRSDADVTLGIVQCYNPIETRYFTSLELPFRSNQPNISCIRTGLYVLKKFYSKRFQLNTFAVADLPGNELLEGRSGIIFHPGNSPVDTEGCILLGTQLCLYPPLVTNSREAVKAFLEFINTSATDNIPMEVSYV